MNYLDPEWDEAEASGKAIYHYVYRNPYEKTRIIKKYTPALAKLISERTGWKIVPIDSN